jgi:hypothetical protein
MLLTESQCSTSPEEVILCAVIYKSDYSKEIKQTTTTKKIKIKTPKTIKLYCFLDQMIVFDFTGY